MVLKRIRNSWILTNEHISAEFYLNNEFIACPISLIPTIRIQILTFVELAAPFSTKRQMNRRKFNFTNTFYCLITLLNSIQWVVKFLVTGMHICSQIIRPIIMIHEITILFRRLGVKCFAIYKVAILKMYDKRGLIFRLHRQ